MGSLMAGWASPVSDPKNVKYQKNWSFTKGEVEAYWKLKKKTEEEHLEAISNTLPKSDAESSQSSTPEADVLGKNIQRSISMPPESFKDMDSDPSLSNGWWTKSNWAFLNEPPVLAEGKASTYTPQFEIANIASQKIQAN